MLMRVAVGIHMHDIAKAIETYNLMSQKYFTHARCHAFHSVLSVHVYVYSNPRRRLYLQPLAE